MVFLFPCCHDGDNDESVFVPRSAAAASALIVNLWESLKDDLPPESVSRMMDSHVIRVPNASSSTLRRLTELLDVVYRPVPGDFVQCIADIVLEGRGLEGANSAVEVMHAADFLGFVDVSKALRATLLRLITSSSETSLRSAFGEAPTMTTDERLSVLADMPLVASLDE